MPSRHTGPTPRAYTSSQQQTSNPPRNPSLPRRSPNSARRRLHHRAPRDSPPVDHPDSIIAPSIFHAMHSALPHSFKSKTHALGGKSCSLESQLSIIAPNVLPYGNDKHVYVYVYRSIVPALASRSCSRSTCCPAHGSQQLGIRRGRLLKRLRESFRALPASTTKVTCSTYQEAVRAATECCLAGRTGAQALVGSRAYQGCTRACCPSHLTALASSSAAPIVVHAFCSSLLSNYTVSGVFR